MAHSAKAPRQLRDVPLHRRGIDAETNGLYDFRARMYSPQLGRFLQTDPISYAGGACFDVFGEAIGRNLAWIEIPRRSSDAYRHVARVRDRRELRGIGVVLRPADVFWRAAARSLDQAG